MSQAAFRALVTGRVQMVMYRDFVKRNANHLNICGEVQNLPDGTVQVIAEGEKNALETLITKMKKGSLLSNIDEVEVVSQEPTGAFSGFSINYS